MHRDDGGSESARESFNGSGMRTALFVCDCVCVCTVYTDTCALVLVTLHVQGQVVGAREAAAAGDALEGFGSGVFPVVSGELVRPGEAPVAALPCAAVRLLTCEEEEDRTLAMCTTSFIEKMCFI